MMCRVTGLVLLLAGVSLSACATKKDADSIRAELAAVQARHDALAAQVTDLEESVSTALEAQEALFVTIRGDLLRQLDDMERQLVEIQELLGQSQIVLQNLRERMELRQAVREEMEPMLPTDSVGVAGAEVERGGREAYNTARSGFQEFLVDYPADELAPDAQYYLAETYRMEGDANLALREYNRVVELYPNSRAAPTALYKAGLLQVEQGNRDSACQYFQRVLAGYPRSDESRLARDQTERLSCR
jgi:tol-pal system protein YbgF